MNKHLYMGEECIEPPTKETPLSKSPPKHVRQKLLKILSFCTSMLKCTFTTKIIYITRRPLVIPVYVTKAAAVPIMLPICPS